MNRTLLKRLILLCLISILAISFFTLDFGQYLTLGFLKTQKQQLLDYYSLHQRLMILAYFVTYIIVTALSLPGAAIMTLAGGAIFGVASGSFIVSFASTIGATLAFLVSRFLLRDYVQNRFGEKLTTINQGIEKEGAFYLFTLRLIPLFPFFIINLVMGVTPIRTLQFYLVSQLGMLPATIVFVNAGSQLAAIESASDILSPTLILSFALLGLFPLIAKKIITSLKNRKYLKRYKKPNQFDYNMIVIGAGSGGLVSAYIASAIKAKVALIEKNKMGGDCLNTGCIPSKTLIRSAKILAYARRAKEFGFKTVNIDFSFAEVMERVQRVIKKIEPHDSPERYNSLGVEVIQGNAQLISPYEIEVNGSVLTTKNIIIATGASPLVPPIPGLDSIDYLTSDTIWGIRECPKNLVILGGGPIGCELAQAFQRLGAKVTIIEMADSIMGREDRDIADVIYQRFTNEGITVLTGHSAVRFESNNSNQSVICNHNSTEVTVNFDKILIALGRKANTCGFGLEKLDIQLSSRGTVEADSFMRTNYPNIYVCGDITGPYQFTHTAAHQAWYAAVNALFSPIKKFRVDYSVIPWATYTDPEVARVGINELDANEKNIPYEVTQYNIDELDRAITDEEDLGVVKVLTVPGKDKILGVTIVGAHAGELIAEFVSAMKHGLGLNKILGTIHVYPTLTEANKFTAGVWKKAHAPQNVLNWLEKFHRWRRG